MRPVAIIRSLLVSTPGRRKEGRLGSDAPLPSRCGGDALGAGILASFVIVAGIAVGAVAADEFKKDTSWEELRREGKALVFGRFEGQFEGPSFRSRKLVFERKEDGKSFEVDVQSGLGNFAVLIPPGFYSLVSFEAYYFPQDRPMDVTRYRPLRQRFNVRSGSGGGVAPYFYVADERPVYIGTLVAQAASDGLVYRGHQLRVLDEFEDAYRLLEESFPRLTRSWAQNRVEPTRRYLLKPTKAPSPLELETLEDPLARARAYVSDGKFQQALNWLSTFLPTNDAERVQSQLLSGEALLADDRLVEAIEVLGEVLLTDPENLRALRLLARAHVFNGDFEDAISLYSGLSNAMPEDVESRLYLGYIYALKADAERSGELFTSAFKQDYDYLLHDIRPFVTVLRVVKAGTADFEPPQVRSSPVPGPAARSRRSWEEAGGLAVLIDHQGKAVAAQMSPNSSGPVPALLMSMLGATYQPAALNGVPVPSLLMLGRESSPTAQ